MNKLLKLYKNMDIKMRLNIFFVEVYYRDWVRKLIFRMILKKYFIYILLIDIYLILNRY